MIVFLKLNSFLAFRKESVQAQFVGSSNEAALREGFEFYKAVKGYASALGMPLVRERSSKLLDFGCGWGGYLRFFQNDIADEIVLGLILTQQYLKAAGRMVLKGRLDRMFPDCTLPYPDSLFDCVIAYSVLAHFFLRMCIAIG